MKHHFYYYGDEKPEISDSALERIQDHARNVYAGSAAALPPPLPADPESARICLREWYAVLDDLSCAAFVTKSSEQRGQKPREMTNGNMPGTAKAINVLGRFAFQVQNGVLALAADYPWSLRETPAFRAAGDTSRESAVLYSDIVALDEAYALLELRSSDEELRLNISGGGKNQSKLYISLYTNGRLVEKSLLGTEVSWDLSQSEPGLYQLDCGDKPVLSFQIQE